MSARDDRGIAARRPLDERIVRTVAAVRGVDATSLEQRLYDAIDPDALERLFASRPDGSRRARGRTTFELAGCRVVVDTEDGITAYRLDERR
ncbi:HalOD1 output domain-containing protein [Halomarina pelagica]|uniref:HalOD1 output domain-containing protein n=1 Tax=Halomarina pelagica TaxID=2961599 RepID=UPI0020C3B6A6|nr:HalOD1 output domain-containing protein [Halomarina sp. BND7]